MPKLTVAVDHSLGADEARRRLDGLLADLKREYGNRISDVREEWNGNRGNFSLKAAGLSVSGTVDVTADGMVLIANLPFAALPFKGSIEKSIREYAVRVLK